MPAPYGSRFNTINHIPIAGTQAIPGHLPTEPMSLGSPTTSPNAIHSHSALTGTQYLPSFLMGDGTSVIQSPAFSPNSAHQSVRSLQLPSVPVSPPSLGTPKHNQDRLYRRANSPPTQSLWSMNQSNAISRTNPISDAWDANGSGVGVQYNTLLNRSMNAGSRFQSPLATPKTPMQTASEIRPLTGVISPDACGTLGTEHLINVLNTPKSNADHSTENCWVTVFGYPASRASYILTQFSQFGTIEKHVITNDGNWMHIKYQNKLQARCALNRNGRVFGDNIMVGVTLCSDDDVLNDRFTGLQVNDFSADRENSMIQFQSPATGNRPRVVGTPLRELADTPRIGLRNQKLLSQSFASPPERPIGGGPGTCGVSRHSSMRSLTGDGRPAYLSRTSSVRQTKESGLLSKALGYMFGWS
ncbi:Nuclear pore complex protein Nup53 [Fasciola hepatica]|uniref:Nucleoporin NUP35 n=1 Tax=Fasciola hepatica TaxID=6192 RepID=A0A4E0R590_FASHE|nr:Nuclear pore complex protein Nup53 [Fasciola hepatica]